MKDTILVEIDRDTTYVQLMSAQSLLLREKGKKLTNNEVISHAFDEWFKSLRKDKNENDV